MTVMVVPPIEDSRHAWPTLGPQIIDWMEANLVFGPGDLRGQPYRLSDEQKALLCRMYEVFPKDHRRAGKRRFTRVAVSLRKGVAKTEFAAAIAAAELSSSAPVRCRDWEWRGRKWAPVGGPVADPYIPMVAYTEEQSDELAYGALYVMIDQGPLRDEFDLGLERIMRIGGDGRAVSLAQAPNARDGARTTMQIFDETHRLNQERQRRAWQTMQANLPKRPAADAWSLEITTTYTPGEHSIAEATMEYAEMVEKGKVKDPQLFFFHREAGPEHDISTREGLIEAIRDASGPAAEWSDLERIASQWDDPNTDKKYLERVWLNRRVQGANQAFDAAMWAKSSYPRSKIKPQELITLGFDGSLRDDATALVATHVRSGFQWPVGIWERPASDRDGEWSVPKAEVDAAVAEAFATWQVWRLYADPSKWETQLALWEGKYGEQVVVSWPTTLYRKVSTALRAYGLAIAAGEVKNNGDGRFAAHIGNAVRKQLNFYDDDGERLWLIEKDRPGSPKKIDAAYAGCLSWRARLDALASGVLDESTVVAGVYFL